MYRGLIPSAFAKSSSTVTKSKDDQLNNIRIIAKKTPIYIPQISFELTVKMSPNKIACRSILILLNEIDAAHELQAEKNAYIDFSSNTRIDNRGQKSHDKKQLLQRADNLKNLSQAQSLALQFCKDKLSADVII